MRFRILILIALFFFFIYNYNVGANDVGISGIIEGLSIIECYTDVDCDDNNSTTTDSCSKSDNSWGECMNFPDRIPPEAIIYYNKSKKDIEIKGFDNLGEEVKVLCRKQGLSIFHLREIDCKLEDENGNSLIINLRYYKTRSTIELKIFSMRYNLGGPKIAFNSLTVDEDRYNINQNLRIMIDNKITNIGANYNKATNRTVIKIAGEDGEITKYREEGLKVVQLITNKGNLTYDIGNFS